MLLRKGLQPNENKAIDMWDRWHRREHTDGRHLLRRGQDVWWQSSDDVKELHDRHTLNTMMLSNPLVILAVGTPAQKWIAQKARSIHSLMVGEVRGQIHLNSGEVERLVVGCPHPETMFFPHSAFYGRLMDAAINFAIGISGLNDNRILENYFTCKGIDKESPTGQWHLRGHESRVVLMARMRNFEKETGEQLHMSQISVAVTQAYAVKMSINHTAIDLQRTLKPGQTLCIAILETYTDASHRVMEARNWSNLTKAADTQAPMGWRSLKKAAAKSMAAADAARSKRNEPPKIRKPLTCLVCSTSFMSRQGLWEHEKKTHGNAVFECSQPNFSKALKSRSGRSKHLKKKHLELEL